MVEFKAKELYVFDGDMLDKDDLTPIYKIDNVGEVIIETEIEPSSMVQETLTFNHEATFSAEVDCGSVLFSYATDFNDNPLYLEYKIPIMVQARWHKKPRINKKWLKRYGMKKDSVLVRCDVKSVSPSVNHDPYYLTDHVEYGVVLNNMEYKFRPDQLRKNLKMEMCYDQYDN